MASAYLQTRDLYQGATYVDQIDITDSNGNPIDLDGAGSGSGSGEEAQIWNALFEIRAGSVDSGAPALVSLTDLDGVVLGNGFLTITLSASQTESIVAASSASVLWAELDLQELNSGEVDTYRWKLNVQREYAREEE